MISVSKNLTINNTFQILNLPDNFVMDKLAENFATILQNNKLSEQGLNLIYEVFKN